MALEWEQVVVGAKDPAALGRWWCEALGWVVVDDADAEFEIQPRRGCTPGLLFLRVDDVKQGKNRLHLDFRPRDQSAEVERLVALGATRVDIGQGAVSWVVLADPEGNEFCVLSSKAEPIGASSVAADVLALAQRTVDEPRADVDACPELSSSLVVTDAPDHA